MKLRIVLGTQICHILRSKTYDKDFHLTLLIYYLFHKYSNIAV